MTRCMREFLPHDAKAWGLRLVRLRVLKVTWQVVRYASRLVVRAHAGGVALHEVADTDPRYTESLR